MSETTRRLDTKGSASQLWSFTARNVRLYFVDRTSVFFSLLGALIAVLIAVLFMKNSIVDDMVASYHGTVSKSQAGHLLDAWLVGSACVIASATTGLGAMRQYASDRETKRWRDFLVTPMSAMSMTLGYYLAAVFVSFLMTSLVLVAGTAYCRASGAEVGVADLLTAWAWLALCSIAFTALFGFITSMLKTVASFTAVSTVVGVLFGFLSETYVHTAALSHTMANVLNALPPAQASALVRDAYTKSALNSLPAPTRPPTNTSMGMALHIGSYTLQNNVIVAVLSATAVVFTLLTCRVISQTVRKL